MENYEYLGDLGSGSYGFVWKCVQRSTGRVVAVKGFKLAHTDKKFLDAAIREVRMLRNATDHPNIIQLLEAFRSSTGRVYMVFAFADKCLSAELHKRFTCGLPAAQTRVVLWQMLAAVAHLHGKKILHRDIKPGNILMTSDGVVKLCDFGFARLTRGDPYQPDRFSSYVVTRWYRSPEMLVSDLYAAPSDIWSLGCTFAELATGRPLFPGTSSLDQLWRIMRCLGPLPASQAERFAAAATAAGLPEAPPPPARGKSLWQRLPELDSRLLDLVQACLKLDPAQRPTAVQLMQMPYFHEIPKAIAGSRLEQLYLAIGSGTGYPTTALGRTASARFRQMQQLAAQQKASGGAGSGSLPSVASVPAGGSAGVRGLGGSVAVSVMTPEELLASPRGGGGSGGHHATSGSVKRPASVLLSSVAEAVLGEKPSAGDGSGDCSMFPLVPPLPHIPVADVMMLLPMSAQPQQQPQPHPQHPPQQAPQQVSQRYAAATAAAVAPLVAAGPSGSRLHTMSSSSVPLLPPLQPAPSSGDVVMAAAPPPTAAAAAAAAAMSHSPRSCASMSSPSPHPPGTRRQLSGTSPRGGSLAGTSSGRNLLAVATAGAAAAAGRQASGRGLSMGGVVGAGAGGEATVGGGSPTAAGVVAAVPPPARPAHLNSLSPRQRQQLHQVRQPQAPPAATTSATMPPSTFLDAEAHRSLDSGSDGDGDDTDDEILAAHRGRRQHGRRQPRAGSATRLGAGGAAGAAPAAAIAAAQAPAAAAATRPAPAKADAMPSGLGLLDGYEAQDTSDDDAAQVSDDDELMAFYAARSSGGRGNRGGGAAAAGGTGSRRKIASAAAASTGTLGTPPVAAAPLGAMSASGAAQGAAATSAAAANAAAAARDELIGVALQGADAVDKATQELHVMGGSGGGMLPMSADANTGMGRLVPAAAASAPARGGGGGAGHHGAGEAADAVHAPALTSWPAPATPPSAIAAASSLGPAAAPPPQRRELPHAGIHQQHHGLYGNHSSHHRQAIQRTTGGGASSRGSTGTGATPTAAAGSSRRVAAMVLGTGLDDAVHNVPAGAAAAAAAAEPVPASVASHPGQPRPMAPAVLASSSPTPAVAVADAAAAAGGAHAVAPLPPPSRLQPGAGAKRATVASYLAISQPSSNVAVTSASVLATGTSASVADAGSTLAGGNGVTVSQPLPVPRSAGLAVHGGQEAGMSEGIVIGPGLGGTGPVAGPVRGAATATGLTHMGPGSLPSMGGLHMGPGHHHAHAHATTMGLTLMAPHNGGPGGLGGGAAVTPGAAGMHLPMHGSASLPYGRASLPVQGGSYVGFSTGSANRRMLSRQGSTVFNQLMYDALPEIGTPGGAPDVPAGTPPPQRRRAVMSGFTPCRTAAARAAAEGLPAAAAMAAAMGSNTTDLSVAFSPIAVARHEDLLSPGDGHGLERASVGAAPTFRSAHVGLASGTGGAYPGASAALGAHRRQTSMQAASAAAMGAAGSDLGPSAATAIPSGGGAANGGGGGYHVHASDTGMMMGGSAPSSHAMHPGYASGSAAIGGSYRGPGQRVLTPDHGHGHGLHLTVTTASGPAGGPPVRGGGGGRLPQAVGLAGSGSSHQTTGSAGALGSGAGVGAAYASAVTPGRSRLGSGILGRVSDDPTGGSLLGAGGAGGGGGGGSHGQHPALMSTAEDCHSALNIELDGAGSVGNNTGGGSSIGMWGFGPMAGYGAGAGAAAAAAAVTAARAGGGGRSRWLGSGVIDSLPEDREVLHVAGVDDWRLGNSPGIGGGLGGGGIGDLVLGGADQHSAGLPPAPTSGPTLAEVGAAVAGAMLAPTSGGLGVGHKLSPGLQAAAAVGQAGQLGLRPKSPAGSLDLRRGRSNSHGQVSFGHGPSGLQLTAGAHGSASSPRSPGSGESGRPGGVQALPQLGDGAKGAVGGSPSRAWVTEGSAADGGAVGAAAAPSAGSAADAGGKVAGGDKAEKSKWPRAKALLGGKLISSLVRKFKDGVQVSDRKAS
ncbi:hypothetical protein HXX76_006549 [Chlamydomonas incerta]|uniref:cyclin-dependent kinase n=1 Tax=Chlamydomonas incerta TaxID=51695 RepID=A0A835SZU4_CHLIN|nr:hypothetical protein HXX76_006549 [Chlamydomonas incerta]|eukprot:KAG2436238.1 hypothetical protein HXX76_006549 [Chlamydomonas incerta]